MITSGLLKSSTMTITQQQQINEFILMGFDINENREMFTKSDDLYIVYLEDEGIIVGCACIKQEKVNTYSELPSSYIFMNNFTIDPEYRGYRLSTKLINAILSTKIQGKNISSYHIRLNVKTEDLDPNMPAIKCYKRAKFIFVPTVHESRNDGIYTDMIRFPSKKSKKSKRKKIKKK